MVKIGLEIHQRLKGRKLFCHCPAELSEKEKPDAIILRKLRLSKSETGELDNAALYEQKKDLAFEYWFFNENCCLVELDEEPPHDINKEALTKAIAYAKAFNMHIFDKGRVMRKIVVDGSNTSGFQRTMLMAINGYINTSKGEVGIQTLCLEEESAGIVGEKNGKRIYKLDRLGIPLVEIATKPDIKDGKHCKEVAERIGLILRAIGGVARGIGTIRQDVNVSIERGNRVEIKGAQKLELLGKIVDKEVERQTNLLKVIKELKQRNAYKLLKDQGFVVIESKALTNPKPFLKGKKLFAMKMPNHKGLLGKELTKGKRYGSELADYARVMGVKGLIHGDENLNYYGIDFSVIKEELNLNDNDSFVAIAANKDIALKALYNVYNRALMDYVPKETRKALEDGNTAFLRPLPSSSRMYPETDIPIVDIKALKNEANEFLKEYEKITKFLEHVPLNQHSKFIRSKYKDIIIKLSYKYDTKLLLYLFLNNAKFIEPFDEYALTKTLDAFNAKLITKKAILKVYKCIREGKSWDHLRKLSLEEIKTLLKTMDIKTVLKKYNLRVDYNDILTLRNIK